MQQDVHEQSRHAGVCLLQNKQIPNQDMGADCPQLYEFKNPFEGNVAMRVSARPCQVSVYIDHIREPSGALLHIKRHNHTQKTKMITSFGPMVKVGPKDL